MIAAGRVSGLFGAKGEVSLVLFDAFPRDMDTTGEPVFVRIDAHAVPLFFDLFVRRGVRGATARFADIDSPERASELVGLEFSIRGGGGRGGRGIRGGRDGDGDDGGRGRGEGDGGEDDSDELLFEDLVGWEATLDTGQKGRITDYFESEHNPLLEMEIDGEKILVPAVEDFVSDVDEIRKKVVLSLPEGLLGLNR